MTNEDAIKDQAAELRRYMDLYDEALQRGDLNDAHGWADVLVVEAEALQELMEEEKERIMKKAVKEQLELIEKWKDVPEGTPVVVTKDDGEQFHTETRSVPWMLGASSRGPGHTAVIKVVGIVGGYLLERIRKDEP